MTTQELPSTERNNPPMLYSARAAMQAAGVKGWEPYSGVSSADAIRMIAAERDAARINHVVGALTIRILAGGDATSFDEMAERLYPGAGLRLPDDDEPDASPDAG